MKGDIMAIDTSYYDNAYRAYAKQQEEEAAKAKATKGEEYDNSAKEAYVQHMQSLNAIPERLAASGLSGGASESSVLRATTGYETNRNKISKERASALSAIDSERNKNTLAYKQTNDAAKNAYVEQIKAEERQAKRDKQDKKEQRFAATISGYDTAAKCDKAIKAAKKSGATWKIPYLQAQKAAIKNGKSGGGSGRGASSSRRSSYSGYGSSKSTTTQPKSASNKAAKTVANAVKNLKLNSRKSSSAKPRTSGRLRTGKR